MALSAKSLAGPGYIILNILRAMNITSLLSIVAASIVMIFKMTIVSNFFFFDAASHVITACLSMFLITSELSIFPNYFAHNWPLLNSDHSFITLGSVMMMLGFEVLGPLNKPSSSKAALGLAFWRIIAGSGILVIVLGGLNIITSFIFRSRSLGITARHVRSDGAITLHTPRTPAVATFSSSTNSITSPIKSPVRTTFSGPSTTVSSPQKTLTIRTNFIRQPTFRDSTLTTASPRESTPRVSPLRSLASPLWSPLKRAGGAILPLFHDREKEEEGKKEGKVERKVEVKSISGPMNVNPQFAHLVKPDKTKKPDERNGGEV